MLAFLMDPRVEGIIVGVVLMGLFAFYVLS